MLRSRGGSRASPVTPSPTRHRLEHRVAQLEVIGIDTFGDLFPRRWPGAALRFLAAGVGQAEPPLAIGFLADDDALVLQQLQGRVDRAGAGLPHAARPFAEL